MDTVLVYDCASGQWEGGSVGRGENLKKILNEILDQSKALYTLRDYPSVIQWVLSLPEDTTKRDLVRTVQTKFGLNKKNALLTRRLFLDTLGKPKLKKMLLHIFTEE